jgi:uncharacterized repeat protein (TIGR01451 family)
VTVPSATDPVLVMRKSGPATMILGQSGNFGLDVQNTGGGDAWNVAVRDLLPNGATGGMCSQTPAIQSAQVFAADGVTAVAGKGPLAQGSDYSFSYSNCQLNLTMLTPAGTISPNQRLIIHYQTQLDATTQKGITLTNIAGAIQWFNGASSVANRQTYTGALTDGTPNIVDNQDAFTVTVPASTDPVLVMRKSGPTTMILGQSGNFGLDVQNNGGGDAWNVAVRDVLPNGATGGMCSQTPAIQDARVFAADGVTTVAGKGPLTQGSDYSFSYSNCQLNLTMLTAAGTISPNQRLIIHYQTQLDATTQKGITLTNIAGAIQWFNGDSSVANRQTYTGALTDGTPSIVDNQDAFTVTVPSATDPVLVMRKSGPATMILGQSGNFGLDVQNTGGGDAWNVAVRDVLPNGATGGMCSQTPAIQDARVFAADGVTTVAGKGPLTQGSDYSFSYSNCQLNLTMLTAAGTISPNQRLIIHYQTQLDATTQKGITLTNVAGAIQWFNGDSSVANRQTYTGPLTDGTTTVLDNQDAFTVSVPAATDPVLVMRKSGPVTMILGQSGNFGLDVQNTGGGDAWNVAVRDLLPSGATGGMCSQTPAIQSAQVFAADGVTAVAGKGPLTQGGDYSFSYSNCQLNLTMLTAAGTISPNQRLIIHYQTQLDANTQKGITLTNIAGAIQWFNGASSVANRQTYTGALTDGTTTVLDNQDAFTVSVPSATDPVLVMRKSGPMAMVPGQSGSFGLDVQNNGGGDAWNVALRDVLPNGATGGMCTQTPAIQSAQVFAADGVTAVAGKGPLTQGTDYSFSYSNCQLNLTMLTAAGTISPNQRLIIHYQTQLDATTQNGATLTNVAGAIQWFNGDSSVANRKTYTGPLTDGTPNVLDNQDAFTVTVNVGQRVSITNQVSVVGGGPALPGVQLDYVLNIVNTGSAPATNIVITDDLNGSQQNQLAYVNSSATANGSAAGVSFAGSTITVNYASVSGPLAPGGTVVVRFRATLSASLALGTVVTNTGVVAWDSPTQTASATASITVGSIPSGQQVSITNQVSVVGGGPAVPGAQLDYVLNILNTGSVPATNIVITDDLNGSQQNQLAYVNLSATANGSAAGVSFAGSTITVNFAAASGPLAPGGTVLVRFRATLSASLAVGTVVTNTGVVAWDSPTQTASASVSIVIGNTPGFAMLNGSAWHDANFDNVQDSRERALAGWTVELYQNNQLSQSVQTDASGAYHIVGVEPNDTTGVQYELRFRAPGAGANTAMLGLGVSPFTNGLQRISNIIAPSGANLQGLNLPIHPNGVIYNSMTRTPIAGATLTLLNGSGAAPLPAGCFDDAAQQGQITLTDGYYKFDINFSDPACPSGGDYLIGVTAPSGPNYVAGYSQIIPPTATASTPAFSVPACPGSAADAIPATAQYCEVQSSEFAPATSVAARSAGTAYYVHVILDGSQIPGSSQIFNNHIPLDTQLVGAITVTKTTPVLNVTRGQLVPYTITATNNSGLSLTNVGIVDRLPAGFTYIKGSALVDGVSTEPTVVGGVLTWSGLVLTGNQAHTVKLLVGVGAGVNQGEFVNRAQALNAVTGNAMSGEATATVRLVPDPTFDCTDVTGKVFNDVNRNGLQDEGEEGLAGVRVVTPTGLQATTDKYGRYHITCAIVPNEARGSNFVLKLDDRTLPSAYRMTTDQVQIQRATSGKALRVNFGASINRVISIDLLDAAFEPGSTDIRIQWKPRVNLLVEELRKTPAVLRLSYVADTEDAALVNQRVEAFKRQLTEAWSAANGGYVLTIEHEIFWRRGAPPKQPDVHLPGSKVTK